MRSLLLASLALILAACADGGVWFSVEADGSDVDQSRLYFVCLWVC